MTRLRGWLEVRHPSLHRGFHGFHQELLAEQAVSEQKSSTFQGTAAVLSAHLPSVRGGCSCRPEKKNQTQGDSLRRLRRHARDGGGSNTPPSFVLDFILPEPFQNPKRRRAYWVHRGLAETPVLHLTPSQIRRRHSHDGINSS